MYTGYIEVCPSNEELQSLYEGNNIYNLKNNQYVLIRDSDGKIIDKKRWNGEKLVSLIYQKWKDFKPLTWKQEFLFDMLSNHDAYIRIIAGVAGSGKSKVTIKFGLHYITKGLFSKIFLVRHNVSVGEKNGFLKGDKFTKIRGWLGFFEDNIDDNQETLEEMVDHKTLDTDSVEYIKGRDIKNSWIIIDEAEDLTEAQFKVIGERLSAGSEINFVGDYEQTTQELYKKDSGLKRAINNLAGNPKVSILVFDDKENDNVRSEGSKIFSYLY